MKFKHLTKSIAGWRKHATDTYNSQISPNDSEYIYIYIKAIPENKKYILTVPRYFILSGGYLSQIGKNNGDRYTRRRRHAISIRIVDLIETNFTKKEKKILFVFSFFKSFISFHNNQDRQFSSIGNSKL